MKEPIFSKDTMKLSFILSLFICVGGYAADNNAWKDLIKGERYKLGQSIKFEDTGFSIKKGTRVKLIESTPLNMIKVQLHRYKISDCSKKEVETDLAMVSVRGDKDAAVGINMSKGCILEVFVEKKDLNKESLLQ